MKKQRDKAREALGQAILSWPNVNLQKLNSKLEKVFNFVSLLKPRESINTKEGILSLWKKYDLSDHDFLIY